jgi:hypothetical protein
VVVIESPAKVRRGAPDLLLPDAAISSGTDNLGRLQLNYFILNYSATP